VPAVCLAAEPESTVQRVSEDVQPDSAFDAEGRVSFDRAAQYYDQTRALPSAALAGVVRVLSGELAGRGRCLEIGVGTGRIALPLAAAGVSLAGIDVSPAMLGHLVAKAGGRAPFPVALADATELPFRDAAFGAALCVHVLHLIPRWQAAVGELLRVVGPGGVLLIDLGGPEDEMVRQVEDRFGAVAGIVAEERPGISRARTHELDELLSAAGCTLRYLDAVPVTREGTLGELIDRLEAGVYSWTWNVDEGTRRRAANDTREWVAAEIAPLETPQRRTGEIVYRAYDLPGA
jgi:SAM-dependent methyltransferase